MTHPSRAELRGYLTSESSDFEADTIEHHLVGCSSCRVEIRDGEWTNRSWRQLRTTIRTPPRSRPERTLVTVGIPNHIAHLIAASPAFRPAWWLSVAAALVFAGIAAGAVTTNPLASLPFLTVAPVLPVIGVALAYGIPGDPLTQIAAVAPHGGFRLLLIRGLTVSASSIALAVLAALFFLPPNAAFIWLIPSLAATAATLALSIRMAAPVAAIVVVTIWIMLLGATTIASTPTDAFTIGPHLLVLAIAVAIVGGARNSAPSSAAT